MATTDFLGRAIETVKKAIEDDTAQNYEKAYQGYYDSLNLFMLALKCANTLPSSPKIQHNTGVLTNHNSKQGRRTQSPKN